MSTKTTFKRVALVTVAALGFGLLSTVPSQASVSAADAVSNTEVTAVAIAAPSAGRINTTFTSVVSVTIESVDLGLAEYLTLRARFDSVPAGSKSAVGFSTAGQTMIDTASASVRETIYAANAAGNELLPAALELQAGASAAFTSSATAQPAGSVGFIPDTVGSYVVTVWHDTDADGALDAAEDYSTKTFTVGSSPTTLTVTRINSSAATGATGNGALVKLTLTNGGVAAGLSAGEGIVITPATGGDIVKVNGTDQCTTAASAACTLTSGMFIGGVAWLNITNATAGASQVYTFAGSGTDVAGISGTFLLTFRASATIATGTTVVVGDTAETEFVDGTEGIDGTSTAPRVPHAATTLTYYTAATATVGTTSTTYSKATVTDTNGRVTGSVAQGITALAYDIAYLLSETAAAATTAEGSFSVSMTPGAIGDGFQVVTDAGTALTSTVATATAVAAPVTVSPSSTQPLAMKNGGSVVYTVTQLDQFGNALPNVLVTLGGGTKNAVVVAPTKSTDANGQAQFTWTDAQAAAAVAAGLTTDTPTFTTTGSGSAVSGGTITWSATGPVVGTVTILGGDNGTTTGVKSTTVTEYDIAAGDGTEAGVQTFTATVKDAAGNLLSGVPVTWTVSGTTAGVLSTTATGYTTAAGVDSASVYGWVNGNYTVTATAGGIAGTAGYTLRQQTALEARAISATVSGTIITATVKDRFGNVVPGVTVYATKTGVGYFGAGVTSTSAVTTTAGIAEFVIAGGDAEVTVSTLDPNAAAGTKAYGQTCAAASFVGCASTSVALTAYTAGTALEAEEGVGASLSAAGVSSAKVSVTGDSTAQTAADAAAEATDAANAATDAANAAAEAADAATAAAQDAADAVAALSAQVASLISGLKSQLTALTNLVIKIQKKVKA
jgi:hypothetical protein